MKKSNQSIRSSAKLLLLRAIAFCLGCFAFLSGNSQPTEVDAPALPYRHSTLAVKALAVIEDGYKRYPTYGPQATFFAPFHWPLGLMGDAGYVVGKVNDANYSKLLLHGGVCLLPKDDKISLSPHLLAGIIHDQIKYKFDNFTSTDKGTNFSVIAGTDLSIPINNKMQVVAKVDYNPSFSSDGVKNNLSTGLGVNINLGTVVKKATTTDNHSYHTTTENPGCHASKDVKELKINLKMIEDIANSVEEIANKIPRVEAKVFIRPEVAVRRGEECCSRDKPPATWTEIKGGVEGGFEVNVNLWGIPDLNYSLKIWPVLVIAEFKCKLFVGPTGKIALEPVGKFYGELFGEKRPDCKACFYWNLKGEGFVRIGVKAGGKVNVYHWHPFGKGEAGFDVTGEPDESIEVSGEASASFGETLTGTYAPGEDCQKPEPGIHGVLKLGKAKANLKITIKLGPLSFDPSYELNIFDGFEFGF